MRLSGFALVAFMRAPHLGLAAAKFLWAAHTRSLGLLRDMTARARAARMKKGKKT